MRPFCGEDYAMHNRIGFQSATAVSDGTVSVGCRDVYVSAIDANSGRKK